MSPRRRRIRIAGLFALVALLVAGALFQVYTEQALEHAEAFRFRRMLVTQAGKDDAYRFFYVTNRSPQQAGGAVEDRFGREREAALRFGRFDTRIEPSLGIGMLINPTDWFRNEEIQLRNVQSLDRADFVAQLRDQIRASPHRSLLVNVNGFRERFPSALRKTAFMAHVLDIDSPVLVFDWPGDQGSTMRGYRRAQQVARESGAELARTLELILREIKPDRMWLLANSMGAEVVVGAFTALYEQPDLADAQTEFEDVILTAPDVSHEEFGRQFKDEIDSLAQELTVYVSSNDRALLMSRILNRERRLGESTVDLGNPDQSGPAEKAFELVEPDGERVTLVDVTPVNRTRNFHNFGLEAPEFFDDVFLRILNPETPESRRLYTVTTPDGRQYQVLTRGR